MPFLAAVAFIGSHVAERLLDRGYGVRIIGRCTHDDEPYLLNLLHKVYRYPCDIRNAQKLERVLNGADVAMHYAALINVDESRLRPKNFYDVNIMGTVNVLEACRRLDLPLVLKSSCEVYGNIPAPDKADEGYRRAPRSPYASAKMAAEEIALSYHRTYGMQIAISRSFNVYGARQRYGKWGAVIPRWIVAALKGDPLLVYGDGQQTRDYTYVGDVAEADVMILEALLSGKAAGESYNVCSGQEYTAKEIAGDVAYWVNWEEPVPVVHVGGRPGEVRRSVGDYSKIRGQLGWFPKTGFPEGLKRTIDYYRGLSDA